MKTASIYLGKAIIFIVSCLLLLPTGAHAVTKQRTCGPQPGKTIEQFLKELNPGDTLLLNGTCNENVIIDESQRDITLDGQGVTTITAPDATRSAVQIRGRRITLRGFSINGGQQGIHVTKGGTATIDGNSVRNAQRNGILVNTGSSASLLNNLVELNNLAGIQISDGSTVEIGFLNALSSTGSPNIIRLNGTNGVAVSGASSADIEGNLIRQNASNGISVSESSSARIGSESGATGSFAAANTIELNGVNGISVARSSSGKIVENIIRSNASNGVTVSRASHADIANNKIDGNGGDGIFVSQNSGVNLGADSGSDPADLPNTTTTNNTGAGIRCRLNSYADGRLGSLNGSPQKDFGLTFTVTLANNNGGSTWGAVDEVDDSNNATANATLLTIGPGPGSIQININACRDSLNP